MAETSNRDNGDQRLNEEDARIAAEGEKDWRDIARQSGVSPEDKKLFDEAAVSSGQYELDKAREQKPDSGLENARKIVDEEINEKLRESGINLGETPPAEKDEAAPELKNLESLAPKEPAPEPLKIEKEKDELHPDFNKTLDEAVAPLKMEKEEDLANPEAKKSLVEAAIAASKKEQAEQKEKPVINPSENLEPGKTPWEFLDDFKVMDRQADEIEKAFKEATGRELKMERDAMVRNNIEARHMIIVSGKEAIEAQRKKIINKEQERILLGEHSRAFATLWERNPNIKEADKEKFLFNIKKRLGLDGEGGNIALDKLINDGYIVEKSKKAWFSSEITLKTAGSKFSVYGSKEDLLRETLLDLKDKVSSEASLRADLKIIEGRKRLLAERAFATKSIINREVVNHNIEQQREEAIQKVQQEAIKEDEAREAEVKTKEKRKPKNMVKPKKPVKQKKVAKKKTKARR
jgi:hypothetical protein